MIQNVILNINRKGNIVLFGVKISLTVRDEVGLLLDVKTDDLLV